MENLGVIGLLVLTLGLTACQTDECETICSALEACGISGNSRGAGALFAADAWCRITCENSSSFMINQVGSCVGNAEVDPDAPSCTACEGMYKCLYREVFDASLVHATTFVDVYIRVVEDFAAETYAPLQVPRQAMCEDYSPETLDVYEDHVGLIEPFEDADWCVRNGIDWLSFSLEHAYYDYPFYDLPCDRIFANNVTEWGGIFNVSADWGHFQVTAKAYSIDEAGVVSCTKLHGEHVGFENGFDNSLSDDASILFPRQLEGSPAAYGCEDTVETCTDGLDNDGDGFFDCSDHECLSLCDPTPEPVP